MKRYLAVLMTVIMLLGMAFAVSAEESVVVSYEFDDFRRGGIVAQGVPYYDATGYEDSVCLRVWPQAQKNNVIAIDVPLLEGETYRISMKMKSDTGDMTVEPFFVFPEVGQYKFFDKQNVNKKWTDIELEFYFNGISDKGSKVTGESAKLNLRTYDPTSKGAVYIDDFYVYAKGDVFVPEPVAESTYEKPAWGTEPASCDFKDTKNHWAESTIDALSANKFLNGVSETEFMPEGNVTRAEFIKMAISALRITPQSMKIHFLMFPRLPGMQTISRQLMKWA